MQSLHIINLPALILLASLSSVSGAQQTNAPREDAPLDYEFDAVIEEFDQDALLTEDGQLSEIAEVQGLEPEDGPVITEAFAQKVDAEGRVLDEGALASGDWVQVGVRVRNDGRSVLRHTIVTQPLPEAIVYTGINQTGNRNVDQATVLYSVDKGRFFSTLNLLRIRREDGVEYPAAPADISHVRWILDYPLRPNQSALLSFRAIVR